MQKLRVLPTHIAIVMDGNGRWAKERFLPRFEGHRRGLLAVREVISACLRYQIPILTLFAFSSENWRRPKTEVSFLFNLLDRALKEELKILHEHGVRLNIIGDRSALTLSLQTAIQAAEDLTSTNQALHLNLAINFGGQWDIFHAAKKMAEKVVKGEKPLATLSLRDFSQELSLAQFPAPDLFIRTSGIYRISNFLLWDLAYTEFYFTPIMWPEFTEADFLEALNDFANRERRFGYTGEQIEKHVDT